MSDDSSDDSNSDDDAEGAQNVNMVGDAGRNDDGGDFGLVKGGACDETYGCTNLGSGGADDEISMMDRIGRARTVFTNYGRGELLDVNVLEPTLANQLCSSVTMYKVQLPFGVAFLQAKDVEFEIDEMAEEVDNALSMVNLGEQRKKQMTLLAVKQNVEATYSIASRVLGPLGNDGAGGSINGEKTIESVAKIIDEMRMSEGATLVQGA